MVDPIGQSEPARRGYRVSATDHGKPSAIGYRLGDRTGSGSKALVLEDTHRAVPEHRLGGRDHVTELDRRSGSDVNALPAIGDRTSYLSYLSAS